VKYLTGFLEDYSEEQWADPPDGPPGETGKTSMACPSGADFSPATYPPPPGETGKTHRDSPELSPTGKWLKANLAGRGSPVGVTLSEAAEWTAFTADEVLGAGDEIGVEFYWVDRVQWWHLDRGETA
jgi:hypothetical protein